MKTESKKLDKCQVELTVTLDAEEMKAIVKDVERAFVREARLPGFRPGKVPVELIRKEFAQGLKQETERAMFQKNISKAIEAEKLDQVAVVDMKRAVRSPRSSRSSRPSSSRPTRVSRLRRRMRR